MKKLLLIGAAVAALGFGASNSAQAGNFSFGLSIGESYRPSYVVPVPQPRIVYQNSYACEPQYYISRKDYRREAELRHKAIRRERELEHRHQHRAYSYNNRYDRGCR